MSTERDLEVALDQELLDYSAQIKELRIAELRSRLAALDQPIHPKTESYFGDVLAKNREAILDELNRLESKQGIN